MTEQLWLANMQAVEKTLYHVTCAMLREEYDRRDAMQETALRAWEKQKTLREEAYFKTWAVRICINVCRDLQRKQRFTAPEENAANVPAPLKDMELKVLLDALPETLRLPVLLHYLDGLSVEETGRALGIPGGTVKFRLHQARKRLRIALDETEEQEVRKPCRK